MTRPPSPRLPALYLAPGSDRLWLRLLLGRFHSRLRDAPRGEALLLEQWWDGHDGEVRLLPFSTRAWTALEAARSGLPLNWTPRFRDRAPSPPTGWSDAWFEVVETPEPDPGSDAMKAGPRISERRGVASTPAVYPGPGGLVVEHLLPAPHAGWVATQTHWIVARDGEVRTATRGRFAAASAPDLPALEDAVRSHLRAGSLADMPGRLRTFRAGRRIRRSWNSGARPRSSRPRAVPVRPEAIRTAASFPLSSDPVDDPRLRHGILLGASGVGKTSALAQIARSALLEGRSVVLFDVHGDLAPRVVAQLPPATVDRLLGIDVSGTPQTLAGLSVFGPVPAEDRPMLIAHLIAALKRLSPESGETYWGFRLERIFETFLRIVQEQDGDLTDLWGLLTDPRRRDAARLATATPELARFLDEIDGLVRRQPEFLWPAASRVSKVVASPLLAGLLAPRDRALAASDRLRAGGSILWRLPIGELGPEGVTFAVTLLLTRIYLDQVRRAAVDGPPAQLRVLFVLDEAHLFPSRLLSEIIAEGRKFGLGLVAATQYPARLAHEVREALTGAAGSVYLFRIPWATAAETGSWAGLSPTVSEEVLPALPAGWAVVSSTGPGADRRLEPVPAAPAPDELGWRTVVARTAEQYGEPLASGVTGAGSQEEGLEDRLLLGMVALSAEGVAVTSERLLAWIAPELPTDSSDPLETRRVLEELRRRGWVRCRERPDLLELTLSGAERVGLTARTGARPESVEHRMLLVEALRIFARRHERLEILRQGRFDTRLPDGRVAVLPPEHRRWSPAELQAFLERRRTAWIWRAFGGREIFVEAEVSGASRRERIERDWTKARDAGAALLVLVSDVGKARSVRRVLDRLQVPRLRGCVWVLSVHRRSLGGRPAI